MTKFQYTRGVRFFLPTANDEALEITPPEGKQLSDFVGWVGFKHNKVDQTGKFKLIDSSDEEIEYPLSNTWHNLFLKSSTDTTFFSNFLLKFDVASEGKFNLYAVWDKYSWTSDNDGIDSMKCVQGVTGGEYFNNGNINRVKDSLGFFLNDLNRELEGNYDKTQSLDDNQVIIPNFPVKWTASVSPEMGLSSVTLNDVPFAGTDVTEAYWTEHRDDLYKDIPDELSVNYVWSKAIENNSGDIKSIMLYLPSVTSSHIKDNMLNFSFKSYALYGNINLFNSYDEAKTVGG